MDTKAFFTNKRNIVVLAVFCTLLWGSAYPGVKTGYEWFAIEKADVFGKLAFAGYRFTLSGVLVLLFQFLLHRKIALPTKEQFPKVALLGLLLTSIHYTLFYVGLANTTGVNGAILNGTGTFFSVLIAHAVYSNDRLNQRKALGTIIGFAGVILINVAGDPDARFQVNLLGDGLIVLAAFVSSLGFIYSKKLSQTMNTVTLTGFQLLLGGGFLVIVALMGGAPLRGFTLPSTALLLYLSLLTAVAYTLWTTLFKYNAVSRMSLYKFLIPIFGAVLSAWFLGETLFRWTNVTALLLVCLGIYVVNKSP